MRSRRRCRQAPQMRTNHSAFTLLEVVLVMALLVIIASAAVPTFIQEIRRQELPESARKMRALITLVRAHAALDGKRYRIRFAEEDETTRPGREHQPIIECEEDPFLDPELFTEVNTPWSNQIVLVGHVWCAEVRLGKPTIEDLQDRREQVAEDLEQAFEGQKENFNPDRPPLYVEPDGSCDWVTFTVTEAPYDLSIEQMIDEPKIDVILDGDTGGCWLQRPFYQEELDLFEEKGWPAVLRQDFLTPRPLTENDVLELHERPKGSPK